MMSELIRNAVETVTSEIESWLKLRDGERKFDS